MDDKRRTAGNDEDIDLSGMINEYSQDNELRKKNDGDEKDFIDRGGQPDSLRYS